MMGCQPTPPEVLLLDIDNTVYPYQPCHEAGLRRAYAVAKSLDARWHDEAAFRQDYASARQSVKSRLRTQAAEHSRLLYFKQMVDTELGFTDYEKIAGIEHAYWEGYASTMTTDAGCRELLEYAVGSGLQLAWVSNYTTARQFWKLQKLGLDHIRSVLVTSEEAGGEKPNPATVDLALCRLKANAAHAWLVGDERADVEVARARGIRSVVIRRSDEAGEYPEGGDFVVRSWCELRKVLEHARN